MAAALQRADDLDARVRAPVVHSHAAIGFCTEGRARVALRGEWEVTRGDVLVVPPGEPHQTLARSQFVFWGAAFCVPCLVAMGAGALLAPLERVREGASPVVSLDPSRWAYVEGLFRELATLREGAAAAPEVLERSLLTLVLSEVEKVSRGARGEATQGASLAVETLRFIERNCLRRLSLDEVAAAVGRSPSHVTSALTRATGQGVNAWIVQGRMAEARRRLSHTDAKLDAVAAEVGYADVTHFIRMFRRHHGVTPAVWRQRERGASTTRGALSAAGLDDDVVGE